MFLTRPLVAADPALRAAGEALLNLLIRWSDDAASEIFADNVAPDGPFVERRARAEVLKTKHGALSFARVETKSRTAGRLVARSSTAEVVIAFSLAPTAAGKIQKYDLPD